jgi:hypothetical protein
MPKEEKTFDAVAWVRAHRDENYRRYGHLPLEQYARKLSEKGEESELWKRTLKREESSGEAA